MFYDEDEYKLYEQGKQFTQALARKSGKNIEDPAEVVALLSEAFKRRIKENRLVVFKGVYGWAVTPESGRSGKTEMITIGDFA